jgi:hypothetical protein
MKKFKYEFRTDTSDWYNEKDAQRAKDLLLEMFDDEFDEYEQEAIAFFMKIESFNDFDFSNQNTGNKFADELVARLIQLQKEVFLQVTKDYHFKPDRGHNCFICVYFE